MSIGLSRRLPDTLAVLTLALFVGAGVLAARQSPAELAVFVFSGCALVVSLGGVGWVLLRRVPGNPLGWTFAIAGFAWMILGVAGAWGKAALAGELPLGTFARLCAVMDINGWVLVMPLSVTLPLVLLPDGRLRSRRWRLVVYAAVVGAAVALLDGLTRPGLLPKAPYTSISNPWGVDGLGPLPRVLRGIALVLLLGGPLAGIVSLRLHWRRATGVTRQQLRWVALGGLAAMVGVAFGTRSGRPGVLGVVADIGTAIGFGAMPVCLGVAVLRYRLYDIDRVVSRTVSYAVVTGALVAVYVGLVTSVTRLTPTGSSLAVAASTLAVAALFQPVRRRVQAGVDRRFNRARYDAAGVVESFSRRLREEVNLDTLRTDLVTVVQRTVQPVAVSLWLMPTIDQSRSSKAQPARSSEDLAALPV